jgi:hypothetical protein
VVTDFLGCTGFVTDLVADLVADLTFIGGLTRSLPNFLDIKSGQFDSIYLDISFEF